MRSKHGPTMLRARIGRKNAIVCLGLVFLEIAFAGSAYCRPSRSKTRVFVGAYPSQVNTSHPIAHDGQAYGLRSGGGGPLNASGSYGAMLEGRNPVGSTGF
jgi:hypothetical protein